METLLSSPAPVAVRPRLPAWLKVPLPTSSAFTKTRLETITTCYDLTEHRIGCRSSTR